MGAKILQIARKLFASLYHRQVQYIMVKRLDPRATIGSGKVAAEDLDIECLLVESPAALGAIASEIPTSIRDSVAALRRRLEQGCLVVFARRPRQNGAGKEVIGYTVCERGIFSALGRRKQVCADMLFTHYMEVLPGYRGQRVPELMRRTMDRYCLAHGVTKRCSVVSVTNQPSIQSSLRSGLVIAGTVERVSVCRGLFVWETPWERVEKALSAEPSRS